MSAGTTRGQKGQHNRISQLHHGSKARTLLIALPGVGTLPVNRWYHEEDPECWPVCICRSRLEEYCVYVYENKLAADGLLSWQNIEEEGADFLGSIHNLTQAQDLQHCTIIFIAHSLGSVILKRATSIIHGQPQRFKTLLQKIVGAVLLSSPHSRSDALSQWECMPLILKTYCGSKSKHSVTKEMTSGLAGDCLNFEKIFHQIGVLSLYETVETRTGGIFGPKTVLIDEGLAKTNTGAEIIRGVKADHNDICRIKHRSYELGAVEDFMESCLARVEEASKADKHTYGKLNVPTERPLRPPDHPLSLSNLTLGESSKEDTSSSRLGSASVGTSRAKSVTTATSIDIIPSLSDFSVEKNDPRLPCHIIPLSRNYGFFGRTKILEALDEALLPMISPTDDDDGRMRLKTFAICGPGGMGKTQIASEFVYRHKKDFDAIFWIHADGPSKIAHDFSNVATSLGLVSEDSVEARDHVLTRDLVLGWLTNPLKSYKSLDHQNSEEASCLVIFDNVDDADILDDYWPMGSSASILITSRDPLLKNYIYTNDSRHSGISLPSFDKSEATNFLLKLTRREREIGEKDSGQAIVEVLGGLPLAITQMAGVIARNELSFTEFLEMYGQESAHAQLFKQQVGQLKSRTQYEHTIASVWALDGLNDGAASLLGILSLLDPDGIPEYILEPGGSTFRWEGYPHDMMGYQEARTELLKSSLITRDRGAKKLFIHRLIQDAARASMSDERFDLAFGFTLCLLSSAWPYEEFGFGNEQYRWARCNEIYRHVLRLQKLFERFHSPDRLSEATIEPPKLLLDLARFSILSSHFSDTIPFLDMAQSICTRLQKARVPYLSKKSDLEENFDNLLRRFHHHRGELSLHTNQPEMSLSSYRTFIQMLRDQIGDKPRHKDQSLGVAWNELGCAYMQNDDPKEAEICLKKSIDALGALEDVTRISISMPLINLAFAYWLQDRLTEAASTFEEALADREKEYGPNDRQSFVTGKLLLGYGNVAAAQGQLDRSFDLHQRCLLHYKSTVGNNHHRTGDGCVKVADHHVRLLQYDSALSLLDQALKIFADHRHFVPEKARVKFRRAKLLNAMNRTQEGELDLRAAFELYKQIRPQHNEKGIEQLEDADFDDAVMFWSR